MNRSKEEKLADVMLGEAVLKLLHDGGAVSRASLTEKLTDMAAREAAPARQQACLHAINDVSRSSGRTGPAAANDGATMSQFLAADGPAGDRKKH